MALTCFLTGFGRGGDTAQSAPPFVRMGHMSSHLRLVGGQEPGQRVFTLPGGWDLGGEKPWARHGLRLARFMQCPSLGHFLFVKTFELSVFFVFQVGGCIRES